MVRGDFALLKTNFQKPVKSPPPLHSPGGIVGLGIDRAAKIIMSIFSVLRVNTIRRNLDCSSMKGTRQINK